MPQISTHLAGSLSEEKLPVGPMVSPRPGPTFEMAVAAPDTAVSRSRPAMPSATVITAKAVTKRNTKLVTEVATAAGIGLPA